MPAPPGPLELELKSLEPELELPYELLLEPEEEYDDEEEDDDEEDPE